MKLNIEIGSMIILLLFAFTLPLSRAAVSFFIVIISVVWLYKIEFKKLLEKIRTKRILVIWLAFIAYNLLSLMWVETVNESTMRELRLLLYSIVLLAISTSFDVKYTQRVINAFLLGLFISELVSYGVFFELWHFKHATVEEPSPFMNHLDYSVFLAFGSILLLNRVLNTPRNKERILYIFFFLSVTGNLFITGGRTGQVALLVALVVWSIMHFKMRIKALFVASVLIVLIFGTAYKVSPNFQTRFAQAKTDIEEMSRDNNYATSLGIRAAYWILGKEIMQEHVLLGVGIGGYKEVYQKILEKQEAAHYDKEFMGMHTPHNQYLLILLNFGVFGLGLFLYFIYAFFKMSIVNQELKELSILFGTIFFVSCVADTFLLDQFTLALFCLFVGVFIANSYKPEDISKRVL